ncbi:MAG: hypothetical protein RL563_611 [Pseudomonadota bacterium]|jgi:AmmeMemoRadiSam system protein B
MKRQPAVAGSFYPDNPIELRHMLGTYLCQAESNHPAPKVIIAPHAGYIYSASIAASAYARLNSVRDNIQRVVLMGPSHRVAFRGLALSGADYFVTPLGEIAIDTEVMASLARFGFAGYLESAHTMEHSLEVHLPFLQTVLANFKLIPIVAGDATPEQVTQVLEYVWGGSETLIVISSDLSHYHPYEEARLLDQRTSHVIETLDYHSLSTESACGKVPVSGLLKLLQDKGLSIQTIDVRNSGDTAGDKNRVVGYGAYVVE